MKDHSCTEDRFLNDVERHGMAVLRDDGVNRHIRFKRPDSGAYWFDLITWPGSLCIDGDCGTYVFRRLEDMFEFFRADRRDGKTALGINPQYWGEKLQATSNNGGFKEFSKERFRENVLSWFVDWEESNRPDTDASDDEKTKFIGTTTALWAEIEEEVLLDIDDYPHESYRRAYEFESDVCDFSFNDLFDLSSEEYTFHFIWCCYAIAWGVKTYDEAIAAAKEAS